MPGEAKLIQLASQGDQQAYGRLYSFYYPHLYTSLVFISGSHEDTQEIIHEVFLKIWKSKEALTLVRSFEDYAYVLAKNLLFNQLRREKTGRRIIQALSEQLITNSGPAPDQEMLFKQYHQTAMAAIHLLPEQKRKVFLLRTQEGLKLDEIAAVMGIAVPTVKKHLYSAMEFVKGYLRRHAEDILLLLAIYFF